MTDIAKIERHEVSDAARPADPMVSMIERICLDPNADMAKLERMLDMKERHEAQQAKAAFAEAFARASAEFPTIPLNGIGHNQKPYATLKDITRLTRPVLAKHGLALTFSIDVGEQVIVTAELMHEAGHSKTTSIALPRETSGSKNAVQAVGSSQTYGQRYTAQAILGLSLGDDTEDDGDGANKAASITEEQYLELRDLIAEAGISEDVVCTAERVRHLPELPASAFARVRNRLKVTISEKAGK